MLVHLTQDVQKDRDCQCFSYCTGPRLSLSPHRPHTTSPLGQLQPQHPAAPLPSAPTEHYTWARTSQESCTSREPSCMLNCQEVFVLMSGWRCRVLIHTWVIKYRILIEFELCFYMQVVKSSCLHYSWGFFATGLYLFGAQQHTNKVISIDEHFRPNNFFFVLCSICHVRLSLPWLLRWLWCHSWLFALSWEGMLRDFFHSWPPCFRGNHLAHSSSAQRLFPLPHFLKLPSPSSHLAQSQLPVTNPGAGISFCRDTLALHCADDFWKLLLGADRQNTRLLHPSS